jgi:hypothetical protein
MESLERQPRPSARPEVDLTETGRRAAVLLKPGSEWVHRRVQRIAYLEPGLQKMQVSVDFTVPPEPLGSHVPISVLPKWPPLYRLDFRDPHDRPVPLLTSEQNGETDRALLEQLVSELSPASLDSAEFGEALTSLACGPETHLAPIHAKFVAGLQLEGFSPEAERLIELSALLTDTTLLWYPLGDLDTGTRIVCKFQYLIRSETDDHWLSRISRALSWSQPAEYIRLWHAGADANFHVDIEVPQMLTIQQAEPRFLRYVPARFESPPASSQQGADESALAEGKGVRPDQHVDISGSLAHLYVTRRRPLALDLCVRFAPTRWGMVASAFASTILIALLTTFFYCWRHWAALEANIDASVAILVLAPALIGYLVVRPSDHPLARRYIVGIQIVSTLAAVVPVAMALLLIRYSDQPSGLRSSWLCSVVIAWSLAAVLAGGFIGAREPIETTPGDHPD